MRQAINSIDADGWADHGGRDGEAGQPPLRVAFDRRLKLELLGARITSDGGLLAYRELDDALALTAMAASLLSENRRGRNTRHQMIGLLRQAV
jgi:Transposase DDE domain group 1